MEALYNWGVLKRAKHFRIREGAMQMNSLKKVLPIIVAVFMLTSILAGCASSTGNSGTKTTPNASNDQKGNSTTPQELKGELTFWHSFTQGPRMEKIQAIADSFMQDNPGVKIKIETFSWADFYTKWTTGLPSGNVPDISSALSSQVVELIDNDAIVPLNDLIERIGQDKFYEKALAEMTTKDGNVYGVPLYSNTQAMWIRKDLLEKYSLDIPKTWDEFYVAAKTITDGENGDVYGAAFPMGTNDLLATRWLNKYVHSAGETLITEDGKANLTSPTVIDGINFWVKIYKEVSPKDSINYNTLDEANMYYQGKLAFDFNTGFHIGGVQANSLELLEYIDAAPVPRVNSSDPEIGVESNHTPFVVWKKSKHPEIAKAFIEYFYEQERYVDFLLSVPVGMMSAIKGVTDSEKYKSDPIVQQFQNADKVLNQMLSGSTSLGMDYGPRPEAGLLTSQRVIENMFQDIIINDSPVEKAAKAAEDKLNELFQTVQ